MSARVEWPVDGATVRILPGPQASRAALERLDGAGLRTAAGDRTGVRFEGAEIPGGESVSEPPPLGAVQITPSGDPFVLLNDRYRTGRLLEARSRASRRPADHRPAAAGMHVTFALVEPGLRWDLDRLEALSSRGAGASRSVPDHPCRATVRPAGAREDRRARADPPPLRVGSRRALLPRRRAGIWRSATSTSRRSPPSPRASSTATSGRRCSACALLCSLLAAVAAVAAGAIARELGAGERLQVLATRGLDRDAVRARGRGALPSDLPRARRHGARDAGSHAPGRTGRAAAVAADRAVGRHRTRGQVHDRRAAGRRSRPAACSGAATWCAAGRPCSAL